MSLDLRAIAAARNATAPSPSKTSVLHIATNLFFNIEDDDVIIFVSPDGDKDFYVKRVIAKPSDEVRIEKHGFEWVFIVNDEEKDNFEVGYPEELMNKYGSSFIVPKNKYFVMGDNRNNSSDSRIFGLFKKSQVMGKVIYRVNSLFDWEKVDWMDKHE